MEFSISLASYILSLSLIKEGKKTITFLPESDVLHTLKSETKRDFISNEKARVKSRSYQKSLKEGNYWKADEGYSFLEKYLPKGNISLLDIGCHVGELPEYLKQTNKWDKIEYSGTDVVTAFIEIAKSEYKDGDFFVSDVQEYATEKAFDVVYSKGTIISTFNPIKSARNILSITSKKVFLLHTPISDQALIEDYYNIMVHSKSYVYTSSVLSREGLIKLFKEKGFEIVAEKKRAQKVKVINKGSYHLYDFLLEKKS